MKQSPLALLAVGLSTLAAISFAPELRAASIASDSAANYTSGTWVTGSNFGTGFGAWNLFGSSGSGGFDGNYVGGTGLSGNSFGIYAGNANQGASFDAQRPFTGALTAGQTFSVDLGHTTIQSNGSIGINFQSGTGATATNVFSLVANGSQLFLNDGGSNFAVTSSDPSNTAVHFTFTYNGGSSYSFSLSGTGVSGSGNNYIAANDISNITQVQFFDFQQGGGENFGFDNLAISVPEPSTYLGGAGLVVSGLMAFRRSRKSRSGVTPARVAV